MSDAQRKHVALFGGSFNPPHVGHVLVASYVLATQPYDELWLVPVFSHPFGKDVAPYQHRLEMCRAVAAMLGSRVVVSEVEGQLGGESRTIRTLRHLHETQPTVRWALVVGSDILAERHSWYQWDEITKLAEVLVVGRQEGPETEKPSVEIPDVSSTDIRRRIAKGHGVEHLVPRAVLEHLMKHRLYRDPAAMQEGV